MKQLQEIFSTTGVVRQIGNLAIPVHNIQSDSRKILPNDCFIALPGVQNNGADFIEKAIKNGAKSIITPTLPENLQPDITYIQVDNSSLYAGELLRKWYDNKIERLQIIGITGTNGKTTIATMLYDIFYTLGYKVGLISTIENKIHTENLPATHTTPDLVSLHHLLYKMYEKGCTHIFMECSSHAMVQNRIAGILFKGCIFTNITHDHLDYHKTFQEYINAKKKLFDTLPETAFALVNSDDPHADYMLQNTKAQKKYYALKTLTDFKGKVISNGLDGLDMSINQYRIHLQFIGHFNAYNALAAYATALLLGEKNLQVLKILSLIKGAKGRFDRQKFDLPKSFIRIIDYAHTPDALEKTLKTIQQISGRKQIITVFGCGGNRDKTKRPLMAKIATLHSHTVIFTADNPRNEKVENILQDMLEGVKEKRLQKKIITIEDRKKAIHKAIDIAQKDDIILIAGKGHENYQEIKGEKYPFDDSHIVEEYMNILQQKIY